MKFRLPLFGKILFWFCLDLGVILLIMLWLFRLQVSAGQDSPLADMIGSKMQAAAQAIIEECENAEPSDWEGILQRHSEERQVQFMLYSNRGELLAGPQLALPEAIQSLVTRRAAFSSPILPPPANPQTPSRARRSPLPMNFSVKTDDPSLYWAGIRVPIFVKSEEKMIRTVLLAVSDTFSGNGVFFDVWPWLILIGAIVIISFLLLLPMVRHITTPLSQMSKATSRIASGRFDIRLDSNRKDEIGELASSINDMSLRLDNLIQSQRRFLADVAHELSSPIARIQMALGIADYQSQDSSLLEPLNEEISELAELVSELLSYSRAEASADMVVLEPVQLSAVLKRAIRREKQEKTSIINEVEEDIWVQGNQDLLVRAMANLLRNAVTYAGSYGPITIRAHREEDVVIIEILDSGTGVPEPELARLFEPFYRVDESRTRSTGGVGLGLAIVKTCVQTCNGQVTAENLSRGFVVRITLLAAQSSVSATGERL